MSEISRIQKIAQLEGEIARLQQALGSTDVSLHAAENSLRIAYAEQDAAVARADRLRVECPLCGHAWRRHDPEDGLCDAHSDKGIGACKCGREQWMRGRIAELARAALAADREQA
jgi:hypothetical protein